MGNQIFKKSFDLAVDAGRKKQSPRTGFIHLFHSDETASDTIPVFENFCFVFALLRKKSVESILEARELLEKLFAFQNLEGNFPIYLHEYPKCYDPFMGLKLAPILIQIERHFGNVIGADLKSKLQRAHESLMKFSEERTKPALWEHRYNKLKGINISFSPQTQEEWFHWLVSEQLSPEPLSQEIPYEASVQLFLGGDESQEKGEPSLSPIDWALAERDGFPDRLICDHPAVIQSAILFPIDLPKKAIDPYVLIPKGVRLLWKGKKLHSLSAPSGKLIGEKILFHLGEPIHLEKGDLMEAALFVDISKDTTLSINGRMGTIFRLGDTLEIKTPNLRIELCFNLIEGEGDFCGQISRANRPSQKACKGPLLYEVYDWRIALRTLRRASNCVVSVSMKIYPALD